MNPQTTYKPHP